MRMRRPAETPIATLNHRRADGTEYPSVRAARTAFLRAVEAGHGINLLDGETFSSGDFTGSVGVSSTGALWAHAVRNGGLQQEVREFGDIRRARSWLVGQACRDIDIQRACVAAEIWKLATGLLEPLRATPGVANPLRRRKPRWEPIGYEARA